MKNVVFEYSTYEKDIFKGDSIEIRLAYFAGFRFIENEDVVHSLSFISFQAVTDENKILTLNFNIKFDNDEDKEYYYNKYCDLDVVGTAMSVQVPSLMQLSCFYKEKIMKEELYTLYAKHITPNESVVYKLHFNKSSFLYIMDVMTGIEKGIFYSYQDFRFINNYIGSDTIKLNNSDFEIRAVYLNAAKIGGKIFKSKYYQGHYIVRFRKEKEEQPINVEFPILEDGELGKYLNESFLYTEEEYKSYIAGINYYHIVDIVETRFSITATFPMNNYTLICTNSDENNIVFLDMNADMFNNIKKAISIAIRKQ